MTPSAFVAECDRRGVVLSIKPSPDGEKVGYRFPSGYRLPPHFLPFVEAHKPAIIDLLRPAPVQEDASRYPTDEEIDQDTELIELARLAEAALTEAEQEHEARERSEYISMIRAAQYAAEANTMPVETIQLSQGVTVANPNEWFRRAVVRAKELKTRLAAETRQQQRFWIESRMDNLNADLETVAQWYSSRS